MEFPNLFLLFPRTPRMALKVPDPKKSESRESSRSGSPTSSESEETDSNDGINLVSGNIKFYIKI